jgi:release factor glutamine methyltransferase
MSGNPTYLELYNMAVDMLDSRFEARQLFTHVTTKHVQHLSFVGARESQPGQERLLRRMCEQRRSGVPLQYLLGEWEFYGLPVKVGRGVLIPRGDTEILVDVALELMRGMDAPNVLDLCSGTGCVAIAIAHHNASARVTALEISEHAYSYLLTNIVLNHSTVMPIQADLHDYTHPRPLDMLICNPPYIPAHVISTLPKELSYEPRRALSGGTDGLDFYHAISGIYRGQLKPGGWICFEVGAGQSEQVSGILRDNSYTDIQARDDYAGIPRVVYARA